MSESKDNQTLIGMTTETVAGDLLAMLVQELRLLPDIWPKIAEWEQNEIIDRVRKRVSDNVRTAVTLIASEGRVTVAADLQKVVFGKDIQAVFNIGNRDPGRLDLAESRGKACLIVVADAAQHMGGVDEVTAMPDQPDLGGMGAAGQVIEQASRRSKKKGGPQPDGSWPFPGDPKGTH